MICCSKCGAKARPGCNCGVAYIPGCRVCRTSAVKSEVQQKSDRAIAAEIGVAPKTPWGKGTRQLRKNAQLQNASAATAKRVNFPRG